jgi:hypothetical protein
MIKIAGHISDLLYCHDCVILPEFGGFIANYASARVDAPRKLIHPPSKNILFNKHVKVNDGLLASKIVKEERVSYEKANQKLLKFVKQTRKKILAGERVEIKEVGVLYLDKEDNIQFIQDPTNFLTSSFGLPSVDFIPVEKKVEIPLKAVEVKSEPKVITIKPAIQLVPAVESKVVAIKKEENSKTAAPIVLAETQTQHKDKKSRLLPFEEKSEEKKKRSAFFWAAAIFIPLFIAYGAMLSYHGFHEGSSFNTASLNPLSWLGNQDSIFKKDTIQDHSTIIPADTNSIEIVDSNIIDSIEPTIDSNNTDQIDAVPETTFVDIIVDQTISTYKYHVIGGCFSKEKYAADFVEEMTDSGYAALEIGIHKGLHRISLGGTDSRKEARKIRKQAKAQGISCWILRD